MEIVRALLNKYADIDIRGQVGAPILSFISAGLVKEKNKRRKPSYVRPLVFLVK